MSLIEEQDSMSTKIERFEDLLIRMEQTQYLPEYNKRLNLLKELEHINDNGLVNLKGRVACEFCVHELLLTQMLLNNSFQVI